MSLSAIPSLSDTIDLSAALSAGASVVFIHSSLLITCVSNAPKRSALPRPSLKLVKAVLPVARSFAINTGMFGEITPAMGPTAE